MTTTRQRLGQRQIAAMPPNSTRWCGDLAGFGARRRAGEDVTFTLLYRTADGRKRRVTIGRAGAPWTAETARAEAKRLLGLVATGKDPAGDRRDHREAPTVAALLDRYIADAEAGRLLTRRGVAKKASTLTTDKSRIGAHVRPLLGRLKVAAVTPRDLRAFMHAIMEGKTAKREATGKARGLSNVRGGKGAAARTMGLLGAIFAHAVALGWRADNPVRGIVRPADGERNRRLSDEEYAALGRALRDLAQPPPPRADGTPGKAPVWPHALAAVRFLALTGWRMGEALTLRWRDVDLATRTARLPDTKTGASVRPLSRPAADLLTRQQTMVPAGADALVFPPARGERTMTGFPKAVARVVRHADLPDDVTAHVLRHSAASVGGDLGLSELAIGAVLGHRGASVTSRYVHHADATLLAAADAIGNAVAERMGDARPSGAVVPLRRSAAGG